MIPSDRVYKISHLFHSSQKNNSLEFSLFGPEKKATKFLMATKIFKIILKNGGINKR